MARLEANVDRNKINLAMPTVELFHIPHHTTTVVGATIAEAIPNTNLSERKGMFVQNLEASGGDNLYLGGCKPEVLSWPSGFLSGIKATPKKVKWTASGSGTNEYYAEKSGSGGDPGLTEPLIMYAVLADQGAETLLVNGTLGSLNDHEWDWGDNDTLGYNTVYFADATGDPDSASWFTMLSYWNIPDASSTYGIKLIPEASMWITLSGTARLFAISDSGNINCATLEFA